MKTHTIALESISAKGATKINVQNGELHVPSDTSKVGKGRHHVFVPGRYALPFCIDLVVSACAVDVAGIETPPLEMNLYVGNGKVHFEGGHISCNDVFTVTKKGTVGDADLTSFVYYNDLPAKEYADISVMFGTAMMWVMVDGQCCFASDKMPYMQLLNENAVPSEWADGLDFSICGGTYTKLAVKSLAVTEYESDEPGIPPVLADLPVLSPFELYVNGLPPALHAEMRKTDDFLLNDLKNSLKFRRTIDHHGHLIYQSPCGLQYGMTYFGTHEKHATHWVQSPKKPDYTSEVLAKLAETSPALADALFSAVPICNPHSRECKRRTTLTYKGKTSQVCRGAISFAWTPGGFEDLRRFMAAAGEVMRR